MTDLTLDRTAGPVTRSAPAPAATDPCGPGPHPDGAAGCAGALIEARGLSYHAGGRQTLHDVSVTVAPGELVAIAGGSGAGKTTLLGLLAGLRAPMGGQVRHDGVALTAGASSGAGVGYVPQDDVIHLAMPLRRTLRYTALLRLPAGTPRPTVDRLVDETLHDLDLSDRAEVAVRALSGGQRKRASIAAELLTHPRVLFLDEPTSGLDPATSAEVMRVLRRLAGRGVTVVLTTHEPAALERCDRVVFLARDGHLAFAGPPRSACEHFGVDALAAVYERLAGGTPHELAERFARLAAASGDRVVPGAGDEAPPSRSRSRSPRPAGSRGPGPIGQWWLLTRRNADLLVRNRLTLAVLAGSPALVTAMMAMLFRPGAFSAGDTSPAGPTQAVFWLAFAGFFFGLTYGLLQVVSELPVLRRERLAGLGLGPYVAAKVAVLLPVLAGVALVLIGVLRALDRLPARSTAAYAALFITLLVESAAALALGLLASSVVADAAQAALALPMLCFPQVLFAGAIVPLDEMTGPARLVSTGLATRYAFEGLGRTLDLGAGPAAAPAAYGDAFAGGPAASWLTLAGFTVGLLVATAAVLRRRCS
jgi:ABC-type multidrug transport system ATPase subunit